ncbi:cobyric acid synthase [Paenibacillus sp. MWE-103]|uniref:Cobyric acid synthase n=1 Tax=Paenibacillus artemisiicola TaxID=1172618 RepID=A0ABS3WE16_9BACL|nr:cobyric acid synthase [Paenibacillus artemisiicola]MBO7746556.1 cobyric acid synthase [Paenibacillus artemisiicola]
MSRESRAAQPARTLMVQGTASDVGKSLLVTALCRILREDGYSVAPFKSQNMSLNSYVTWDGKEIGRAQGMQADACGILATTDMNPILLKPKKDMVSQVIVHGKPLGDYEARTYREEVLAEAGPIVRDALRRLRGEFDVVVLEGAGSPAEINLKDRDIVNMRAAAWADAPVVLAADIDRGGVFASIVGTLELLEPEERARVCGFVINKFRGDVSLLQPGLDWLEARTGKPVLGVVPYLADVGLEDEDSLSLDQAIRAEAGSAAYSSRGTDALDIAVVRLPHLSNFTDLDPLRAEPDAAVRFVSRPEQWGEPDAVIVPGSKNTVDDLLWLRASGLAERLETHRRQGGRIVGLCGGYEMFGETLRDPDRTESDRVELAGFGWFPFDVRFSAEKRTVRADGNVALPGLPTAYPVAGYEIHTGIVEWRPERAAPDRGWPSEPSAEAVRPFRLSESRLDVGLAAAEREAEEGCASADGRIWGTFLHGVLHNDDFRRAWLNGLRASKGWATMDGGVRFNERREAAFARLAAHVRQHVDVSRLKAIAGLAADRTESEGVVE